MEEHLRRLALADGRFSPEAYHFLLEALEVAIELAGKEQADGPERHVTGGQVLLGLEHLGLERFGPLGATVWRLWGVRSSLDWGHIVFRLVEVGRLSRQESDSLEDFRSGRDPKVLFGAYRPKLPETLA